MVELDQLKVKWDAIMAHQIEENKVAKEKLLAVITNCQKMKQLPIVSKSDGVYS